MGIFGTNWRDVLIVYGTERALYESQTDVAPTAINEVRGYPSGFL